MTANERIRDLILMWVDPAGLPVVSRDGAEQIAERIVREISIAPEIARHRGSFAHDLRVAAEEVSEPTRADRLRTLAEWLDTI